MKTKSKIKPAGKRNLFAELGEGMTALANARQGNGHFVLMRSSTSRRQR